MTENKDIHAAIVSAINSVRKDTGRDEITIAESDALTVEMGLDSLDLAVLVVSLERTLGVDPFRDGTATARTLGDLVAVYEKAMS